MNLNIVNNLEQAIKLRNISWKDNNSIPTWIDVKTVGLDQFFTKDHVAEYCIKSLINTLNINNENVDDFIFIEPSAGSGAFYKLLPAEKRVGMDIMPLHPELETQDFLSWEPHDKTKKYIFIGNPPFGYRAWLALTFMNHAAKFAEYIGFILPMAFQSEGKGSPKNRVIGMQLIHSEHIASDSFVLPNGEKRKVNALWQIWKKGSALPSIAKTCKDWLDLFTVDLRKERLCGVNKIEHADFFLQRTYYREPPSLVKSFTEVKYVCGYGLIIKKDKAIISKILYDTDWHQYSNLAAHNCRHISMYHIEKALTDKGYMDV
jgi:hypothetical protein